MTVLVAYGSRAGSTAQIAEWIADELRHSGCEVDLRPAAEIDDVARYEAVILGAAIYAAGWHTDAR